MTTIHNAIRRRQRGYSLIEIIVAVGVSTVIVAVAGRLTISLLNLRSVRRDAHDVMASWSRLDRQWREDVRAARRATQTGADSCRLILVDDKVVEYRAIGSALDRTARRGTELVGRDTYQLPAMAQVTMQVASAPRALARLSVVYPAVAADSRERRMRQIEAPLAADQRFVGYAKDEQK